MARLTRAEVRRRIGQVFPAVRDGVAPILLREHLRKQGIPWADEVSDRQLTALVRRCWEQIREVNCDRLFRRGQAIARCEDMLELARAKGDVAGEAKVQDLLCRLTGAYSPPRIRIDEPPD